MIRPCAVLQTAVHPVLRVVSSSQATAPEDPRPRSRQRESNPLVHPGKVVPNRSAIPALCERTGSNRRVTGGSRVPSHSATLAWSLRRHGRKESNLLPRIWNPRRCLSSTVWRPRSGLNRPHAVDSGAASPDAYVGNLRVLGASRTLELGLGDQAPDPPAGTLGHSGESNPFEPGHNRSRCRSYCTMVEATRIERAGSCSQNRRAAIAHHLGAASSNRTSLSPSSAERFRQSSYRSASYRVRVSNPSGEGENLTTSRKSNAACSAGYFFGTACQGWSRRVESNHPGPRYE